MGNKITIGIGVIIILLVSYWLISPLWRDIKLDETLPGAQNTPIKDNLINMDEKTKMDFEKQTEEMKEKVMKADESSLGPVILKESKMVSSAHDIEGIALFVKSENKTFLRFENLKTINGPDLRIYLSTGLGSGDVIDLGPIKATEGNVNYPIPEGTDLNKYKNVLIWCRAFSVLFSYAEL